MYKINLTASDATGTAEAKSLEEVFQLLADATVDGTDIVGVDVERGSEGVLFAITRSNGVYTLHTRRLATSL